MLWFDDKWNIDKQSDERRCLGNWETYLLKATYTDGGDNSSEGGRAPRGVDRGLVVIPVSRCPIATTDHLQLHGTLFNWLGKVNISKVKAMLTCIKSQPFFISYTSTFEFWVWLQAPTPLVRPAELAQTAMQHCLVYRWTFGQCLDWLSNACFCETRSNPEDPHNLLVLECRFRKADHKKTPLGLRYSALEL